MSVAVEKCNIEIRNIDDLDAVNQIILNEFIQDDISDDLTKNMKLTYLPNHVEWLGVYVDDKLKGLYLLIAQNSITAEIHTCLLPDVRGVKAIQAGKALLLHLFSKYKKAISYIPEYNKKATLYASMLGFKIEGINRESFLKNGKIHDQYLVGITKGEFTCQQQQQSQR
jgi:RimJ/RimL family protein N-acetyltransferase